MAGAIAPGDTVSVWPSGLSSRVTRIVTWDGDLDTAHAPMSVTIVLDEPPPGGKLYMGADARTVVFPR